MKGAKDFYTKFCGPHQLWEQRGVNGVKGSKEQRGAKGFIH